MKIGFRWVGPHLSDAAQPLRRRGPTPAPAGRLQHPGMRTSLLAVLGLTSMESKGAMVGAQRPDGSSKYIGVDTSGTRPTYSLGGSTAGDLSYSAGVFSDGKEKKGVKAGVTLKY